VWLQTSERNNPCAWPEYEHDHICGDNVHVWVYKRIKIKYTIRVCMILHVYSIYIYVCQLKGVPTYGEYTPNVIICHVPCINMVGIKNDEPVTWLALLQCIRKFIGIYPLVNYHNYGKSPCSMGKSTISMVMFNSYVSLPEGNHTVFMGWIPQPTVTCHISPMCATGSSRTYTTQKTKPLKKTTHWYTKSTSLYVIVSLSHILVLLNKCFTSCWGRYCTCWGGG